MFGLFFRDPIS